MENITFDDGWHQLEIHSDYVYSKELAQKLENALEDVGAEITHYSGEDRHFGRSVHNSTLTASVYTFRLKESIPAVDIHQAGIWAGLDKSYVVDYKWISLSKGETLVWTSDGTTWWDELWKKAKNDLDNR